MQQQRPTKFGRVEFAVEEHQVLQSTLRRNLAPEMVSQRQGPGGQKLAYIEGWRLIALANEVFGFNGWSHSVTQQVIDCVDQVDDKFYVGVSATVRVELKDGVFHEDIGYGVCEGLRSKALSLEKARKEAATDGLKRALKVFGNVLGNCLGNKTYLRWANKCPVDSPAPPNKKETVLEVPPDVHQSRYSAMEAGKQKEIARAPPVPTANQQKAGGKENSHHPPPTTTGPGIEESIPADGTSSTSSSNRTSINVPNAISHPKNSSAKDIDALEETDPVKLERKRRQQQKKEEFLQQLKRRRSDDNLPVNVGNIKSEAQSPIAEDDTETWMRDLDPDTFRLAAEVDWSDSEMEPPSKMPSVNSLANKSTKQVPCKPTGSAQQGVQRQQTARR